jgi:type IV pilus assembly protein PilC
VTVYSYIALDGQGVEQKGELEALDERDARVLLRAQRLRLMRLMEGPLPEDLSPWEQVVHAVEPVMPRTWMPARGKDLALLFRQMSLMLRAGHTLVQSLDAAARLTIKHRVRGLVNGLARALREGKSLSAAMEAAGRPFTPFMVKLTASGEVSGELDVVLDRLANDLDRKMELKRQLINSLTYPVIVLLMAVGVFSFLAVSVVPRFASFIESRGRDVPAEAQMLLDISAWATAWGGWVVLGLLATVGGLLFAYATPRGRGLMDRALLWLPLLGGAIRDATMAQTAWTLGLLLKSGATAIESLRVVTHVAGNRVYVAAFEEAENRLLTGKTLAKSLNQRPIPHMMRHMVEVGEGTGQIDQVMEAVGEYFRKSLDARIKLMASLIEPILLIFVGSVVGFVYYAFFKTIMSAGGGGG